MPLTAQRYEIVRARDRRASSKHAVSTNRKSSTVFIGIDKSQPVAISLKMGKINIPNVYNWIPIFNEIATGCDVSIPVTTVDDFRFVLTVCFEDARRSRARTISYRWAVSGTSETRHGDIKAVSFKEKSNGNSSKSGSKTLSVSKAE